MKTLLTALFFAAIALAQVEQPITIAIVDQTGACSPNGIKALNQNNQKLFKCVSGSWQQQASAGVVVGSFDASGATSSIPFPQVTADQAGSCSPSMSVVQNNVNGKIFTCLAGTWIWSNQTGIGNNQGTVHTILHGNASGAPAFNLVDVSQEITGILAAAAFPALSGDVTTSAGSTATSIATGAVTNNHLAGGIDLSIKVINTLPVTNGGWGSTNGSFTSPSSIVLTAGGTNQPVRLTPSGTGMTILDGNVCIGCTSGTKKLNITGDINMTGDLYKNGTLVPIGGAWTISGSDVYYNGGKVTIGATSGNSNLSVIKADSHGYEPSLNAASSSNFSLVRAGGTLLAFNISENYPFVASIQHHHAASDGLSYPIAIQPLGGSVGIGVAAPTLKLQVAGNDTPDTDPVALAVSDPTNTIKRLTLGYDITHNWGSIQSVNSGIANTPLMLQPNGGALTIGGRVAASSGTAIMNGNVGIGTTAPTAKLDVEGAGVNVFKVVDTTNGNGIYINPSYNYYDAYNHIFRSLNGTSEYMRILGNGNVGIGTTSPGYKLTVSGGAIKNDQTTTSRYAEAGLLFSSNASATSNTTHKPAPYEQYNANIWNGSDSVAKFLGNQVQGLSGTNSAYYQEFFSSDVANIMVFRGDTGNVGIGTTSPGQALEVNGGLSLNTSTAQPTCDSTVRTTLWFFKGAAGVKDSASVCAKDASDSYSWRVIF